MRAKIYISALAGLALLLFAAGCGGGSSSGSDTGSGDAVSKAQFIKQADAICLKADKAQTEALGPALTKYPGRSRADVEKIVVVTSVPAAEKEVEDIAALPAPAGDDEEVATILEEFEGAIKHIEEDPGVAVKGGLTAVNKKAQAYGFKACSEPL